MQNKNPFAIFINLIVFFVIAGNVAVAFDIISTMSAVFWGMFASVTFFIIGGLRVIDQYDRGVVLTFGRYTSTRTPGLTWIFLGIQRMIKIDLRVKVIDVPEQESMTKDNVSASVNAVIYYYISSAEKALLEVESFAYAVSQLAQTTMRDVVGTVTLDELLTNREEVSSRIQEIVDKATDPWGVKVQSVDLKHIELPTDMKRTMGKEAEAEREKRAVIIKAEGEKIAAHNLADAARVLSGTDGALHLRTLHTLNDLSSDQSNTVIFAIPLEVLRAFDRMGNK